MSHILSMPGSPAPSSVIYQAVRQSMAGHCHTKHDCKEAMMMQEEIIAR